MESVCLLEKDGSSKTINIPDFKLEQSPKYPFEWFQENPGQKPPLTICVSSRNLNTLATRLGDAWGTNTTMDEALEFIYIYVKDQFKATLAQDWVSYGVNIGRKGDTITPFDLLEITEKEYRPLEAVGTALTEDRYLTRLCDILAIYRLETAQRSLGNYQDTVVARMETVLRGQPFNVDRIDTSPLLIKTSWARNDSFRKVVAAIDMFMVHFKDHLYSPIRVATLTSRDKDCGGIVALQDLSKIMGRPVSEALTYVLDRRVGEEVQRLIKEGSESGKEESYFHYFKEMSLSQKSPFSSSMNPVLYNFTYSLGAMLGQVRSCHAKLFSTDGIVNVINVAAYVAYYTRGWAEANVVFYNPKDKDSVLELSQLDPEEEIKNNLFILKKIQENDGNITDDIKDDLKTTVRKLTDLRPGTIGQYLRNFFG